ncbi:hypothetical protein [Billgrantia kenyensis]|uniref:Uncharacterized protein n=1 Tax=Billgrantia kenyensis TaxID=321266 RepID=A0A7W0AF80_9GAMM|nr:hypothetical protein [Halomonas kenyensis]MBA2781116.1 hypothetical protein [Halomonas kenyensis]MCG6659940.1 hypothetical protein [Halomonas kenyensis]
MIIPQVKTGNIIQRVFSLAKMASTTPKEAFLAKAESIIKKDPFSVRTENTICLGQDGKYHPKGSSLGVHGKYEEPEGAAQKEKRNQNAEDC